MKKIILPFLIISLLNSPFMSAQDFLNAEDSNPNKMGWMKGFPPQKDSVVSVAYVLQQGVCTDKLYMLTQRPKW